MGKTDDKFYDRADAHIYLTNDQISEDVGRGKASSSMMYATARFNAWLSATGWDSGEEMKASRKETLEYFVAEYRKMLEENLDDYIDNFADYMQESK